MSDRTQLRRLPSRGSHQPEVIHSILDAAFLAHIGFVVDGQPFVIPTLYGRDGDTLFVHGSSVSRMLRELDKGIPACITVTLVDALVLARSAFHHSMNYRSAVLFGTAKKIEDDARKLHALKVISDHLIPERWDAVRAPNPQELKATAVLEFKVEEASAKIRTGPPKDDDEDCALPIWAGLLPLSIEAAAPIDDEPLPAGTEAPTHVRAYAQRLKRLNGK